ncbi:MAG: HlyD family type I secretion periplasmic adaptor subunit [Rhodospirillaceae bacterium]
MMTASLRHQPSRRQFLIGSLALAITFGLWSSLAPLDVISNAKGEVAPATKLKAIQHFEGGIVKEILVEEGAIVHKGDALIRLDPIRADSDTDELRTRLIGLRIEVARLAAEVEGNGVIRFPEELERSAPDLVAHARDTFDTRLRRFNHDMKTQENLINQRESDLRELGLRIANNRKTFDLLSSQVSISENMLKRDLTSRMAHLELLRQQQAMRTLIDGDSNSLPRAQAALREARERLGSVRETFLEKARIELASSRQQVEELSQRANKFENTLERTTLRSPVDGIIKTIGVATEGGVIQAGQVVVEVVPIEDRLIIDAQLPIQDIGYVHRGQEVRVTLEGPDAAVFGHLDGTVIRLSPDAIVTSPGNSAGGARSFYKVRIETKENHFNIGNRDYQLYPGMQVLCSIKIGTRTVFEYLLSPWFRSLRFAFQER